VSSTALDRRVSEVSDELVSRGARTLARRLAEAAEPEVRFTLPARASRHPDALDRDPDGTVAKARGLYLRALGKDPSDPRVAILKQGAYVVAREAERRRLVRDAAATEAKWKTMREAKPWPGREVMRSIWYGIPFVGAPELLYPGLDAEDALTRGEWIDWVNNHRQAGIDSMIDHLGTLIPPREGETYEDWRARLKRRRLSWSTETDEVVVNRSLYAPPRPAAPRSPERYRRGTARKGRRTRARPSRRPQPAPPGR
jgi:hypothetical protein